MSSAAQYRPHYTVEDYQHWQGDWELWFGAAVSMSPSPFGLHGVLAARMTALITNAIESANCDALAMVEIDWIVSNDTVIRPDLSVICGPLPEKHIVSPPALVVEILSAGTRGRDLKEKRDLYQSNGVGWYLIVDPENDSLQALRFDETGTYQDVEPSGVIAVDICEGCDLEIDVSRLFR